jgi:hypothetical protein
MELQRYFVGSAWHIVRLAKDLLETKRNNQVGDTWGCKN